MEQAGPSSNKRKTYGGDSDESENAADVAVAAPNQQQVADILKLDIDCFEETFDYLPAKDLISVGKTCKRLQQVAAYCFSQNYCAKPIHSNPDGYYWFGLRQDVTHFALFIRILEISPESFGLQYLLKNHSKLRRLKQINFLYIELAQTEVDRMAEIMNKVEDLCFRRCKLNLHELTTHCPNLRHLVISKCDDSNFNFLNQNYPKLEYFKFDLDLSATKFVETILGFLERNPNIRKFATEARYLWTNRNCIKNASDIKLDELAIRFSDSDVFGMDEFVYLFNELHECGFYKRLQVYISYQIFRISNQELVDQLANVNGLVKLYIFGCMENVTLSTMHDLHELCIPNSRQIINVESMANQLRHLKRVHFRYVHLDDLVLMIKRAPALEKIRLNSGIHSHSDTDVIDLSALNRQREHLPHARKITLFVIENIYLATKWALKETNLNLIRLKRIESFEWYHDFIY